jgi:hypothetical protein
VYLTDAASKNTLLRETRPELPAIASTISLPQRPCRSIAEMVHDQLRSDES